MDDAYKHSASLYCLQCTNDKRNYYTLSVTYISAIIYCSMLISLQYRLYEEGWFQFSSEVCYGKIFVFSFVFSILELTLNILL
jgi:hypothetical protein